MTGRMAICSTCGKNEKEKKMSISSHSTFTASKPAYLLLPWKKHPVIFQIAASRRAEKPDLLGSSGLVLVAHHSASKAKQAINQSNLPHFCQSVHPVPLFFISSFSFIPSHSHSQFHFHFQFDMSDKHPLNLLIPPPAHTHTFSVSNIRKRKRKPKQSAASFPKFGTNKTQNVF